MIALQLGDVGFFGFEIPDSISWGGEQVLSVHQLIGGARVIDALGRSDMPLEWSGRFRGANAVSRARRLDALRVAGKPLVLTWSAFRYTVVVQRFTGVFDQAFEVPYSISCVVASDDATPVSPGQGPSVDDMMSSDMTSASDLGDDIGNTGLTALLVNLQTAISAVPSFVAASRDVLNTVSAPIQAVQSYVGVMIGSDNTVLGASTALGGVLAGVPAATSSTSLLSQVAAMTQVPMLYDLANLMGRMTTNLAAVRASGSTQTVAGGDLLHMASAAYGDANEWPTIAQANGLTDPVLTGVNSILIPPSGQGVDGVLQP